MKNAGETKQGSVASDLQAEADSLRRQRDNAVRFDRNGQHSRVSERKFSWIWKHLWKFTVEIHGNSWSWRLLFLLGWKSRDFYSAVPMAPCFASGSDVHRGRRPSAQMRCISWLVLVLLSCHKTWAMHWNSRWPEQVDHNSQVTWFLILLLESLALGNLNRFEVKHVLIMHRIAKFMWASIYECMNAYKFGLWSLSRNHE